LATVGTAGEIEILKRCHTCDVLKRRNGTCTCQFPKSPVVANWNPCLEPTVDRGTGKPESQHMLKHSVESRMLDLSAIERDWARLIDKPQRHLPQLTFLRLR
jgi:hypothetical protein